MQDLEANLCCKFMCTTPTVRVTCNDIVNLLKRLVALQVAVSPDGSFFQCDVLSYDCR